MTGLRIGYARVSTEARTSRRSAMLTALGVEPERIYVDHGLTGTSREHPGLRQALAACRAGDALVVTKLDRLARSLPDARTIADELTARSVKLNLGGAVHGPHRPGRVAVVQRAGDGGGVRGRPAPDAHPRGDEGRHSQGPAAGSSQSSARKQEAHLLALREAGEHTISELEELFSVTRSTIYRAIARARARTASKDGRRDSS